MLRSMPQPAATLLMATAGLIAGAAWHREAPRLTPDASITGAAIRDGVREPGAFATPAASLDAANSPHAAHVTHANDAAGVIRATDAAAAPAEADPPVALGASNAAPQQSEVRFDGRPIEAVEAIEMTVTAYSPDARSCGIWADGVTASGYSVWTNGMRLVAADTDVLPFGSLVSIPGYHDGRPVPVLDRGGAIRGLRLDVLMPTHEAAMQWGVRKLRVTRWAYTDEPDADHVSGATDGASRAAAPTTADDRPG